MGRPVTVLMITFLALNIWAGMLMQSGYASHIGIETNVGGGGEMQQTQNQADNISTGAPTGSTLFGMYNVLGDGLTALTTITTAGPTMLSQAGVPSIITDALKTIFLVVIALGVMSFVRGWGL